MISDKFYAARNQRYADAIDIRLVNLSRIALFRNLKLTTSSGKHLKNFIHAHIVSLLFKLKTRVKNTDDLSIGFDRDRSIRQRELTNYKNKKGKYHLRILLREIFRFAQHQQRGTYGLLYRLTLTGNNDNSVLNKDNATIIGKLNVNAIQWYVVQYTPNVPQQVVLSKHNLCKVTTELQYLERFVFLKDVKTQKLWSFEIGTREGIKVPIWTNIAFRRKQRQDS